MNECTDRRVFLARLVDDVECDHFHDCSSCCYSMMNGCLTFGRYQTQPVTHSPQQEMMCYRLVLPEREHCQTMMMDQSSFISTFLDTDMS